MLNNTLWYWIGIRYKNWSWKPAESDQENIFTLWSNGKPKNYTYECVCVDPNGSPTWSWTDCDCAAQRQFVCLKSSHTTTAAATTTFTATLSTFAEGNKSEDISITSQGPMGAAIPGIALGVGIGAGVFIILVVALVAVMFTRKRKIERVTTTSKTSQVNLDRSTAGVDVADQEAHNYQHLQSETAFGPSNTVPLYDQLNQPENLDYDFIPENT